LRKAQRSPEAPAMMAIGSVLAGVAARVTLGGQNAIRRGGGGARVQRTPASRFGTYIVWRPKSRARPQAQVLLLFCCRRRRGCDQINQR